MGPGSGKKRPPSPSPPAEDDDSSMPTTGEDGDEWVVSDNSSDSQEDEDHENQGTDHPFTVDDFPRASCDHNEQKNVLYVNPQTKLRGPSPIRLYPPFKGGKHVFGSDYNLGDKSEISINNVGDCSKECCCRPMCLLQFVSIKIAGYRHTWSGRAKIFGFIAARDTIKPLRNYVYRRDIDNCEAVSVKRKTIDDPPEDEPRGDCLIEGCTEFTNMLASESFIEHQHLYGERCALDVKYLVLMNAVVAQVDIEVLYVGTTGINMKLCAKTSGFSEVIQLFRGAAPEPGCMMSFVVVVERYSDLDLYIEGSPTNDHVLGQDPLRVSWWQCNFGSGYHGTDEEVAKLDEFATFSVKITWKSHRKKP